MRPRTGTRPALLLGLSLIPALAVAPLKATLDAAMRQDVGLLPAVAAVVVAAWFGGLVPGLIATGLSIIIEVALFTGPSARPEVAVGSDRVQLLLFGLLGLLASFLAWVRVRSETDSRLATAARALAEERTALIVRRLTALQGLAAELAGALTRDQITNALLTHGIASLQADGAVAFFVDPAGEHLEAIGSRGYSPAGEQAMSDLPLEMRTPATDVARTGEPVFIEEPAEYAARYGPSLAAHGIELLLHSVAAVPLAIDDRSFGVLAFTWDSPHEFAEDRRAFIAAIARLGASALERARLSSGEIGHAAELEAVIGALGEGIIVIEPNGSVRSDNSAAARLLGGRVASLADLLGRLRNASGDGPSELPMIPTEFSLRARGDAPVEIVAYPVAEPAGTSPPTLVVVCRDMTAFRQGQGLREAFLSLLSHELRTPVTTIYGGSSVLTRPSASLSEETRTEILADIAGEANRLYRLVEDLLVLARFDEGIDLGGEPSLLQRLVPQVVEQERMRWPAIRFAVEVGPDLPAVRADETSVQQVLRNLLSNAAKYSSVGSVVDVTVESAPGGVAMRVRDHGAGVDPDEAENLFEPFYRSAKTAKLAGGAGIGLYVSRRLVDAMDGRIWAAPAEGGGSEFSVVLPTYGGEFSD